MKSWIVLGASVAGLGLVLSAQAPSHRAPVNNTEQPRSSQYQAVQDTLARGWNTWDVHSVATQVLLPEGLAIHVGMKHNTSLNGDAWLGDALIGRLDKGAEVVTPGPHAWDGSYTSADYAWQGHKWRVESAHDGDDLVMLVTPRGNAEGALPPTVVFSVDFLWDRPGLASISSGGVIWTSSGLNEPPIPDQVFCTCVSMPGSKETVMSNVPVSSAHFAADLTGPVGVSTGRRRSIREVQAAIARQKSAYESSIAAAGSNGPIFDAIQTTLVLQL